jgi:hypothetical protein
MSTDPELYGASLFTLGEASINSTILPIQNSFMLRKCRCVASTPFRSYQMQASTCHVDHHKSKRLQFIGRYVPSGTSGDLAGDSYFSEAES